MTSIMIVDDHPMVREGLAAMLESEHDFSVSALAATGEEAVAIAGLSKPDVVLSDIRMPGIDGFGVLAKLREIHPDIRVLLMAGMPLKEEEARAREEGAKGYLPKRELDVLKEVASGKQRDAIAASLGIGAESVKTHLKGIMTKLGCPNATSAVSRAYELGILRA